MGVVRLQRGEERVLRGGEGSEVGTGRGPGV